MLFLRRLAGARPSLCFSATMSRIPPAPGDEIGQELGFGIGQRPDGGLCGIGEAGDDGGVERSVFALLPSAWAKARLAPD